jgi:hypothetical protein
MMTRRDAGPFALLASTAAASGVALGLFLSLPGYLSEPVNRQEPLPVSAMDPNLAKYWEVIQAQGVSPTPYIYAASYVTPAPEPAASEPEEKGGFLAWIERGEAAFRQQHSEWEQERASWLVEERERAAQAEQQRVAWLEANRRRWAEDRARYEPPGHPGYEPRYDHQEEPAVFYSGYAAPPGAVEPEPWGPAG